MDYFYPHPSFDGLTTDGRRYLCHRQSRDMVRLDEALWTLWSALDGRDMAGLAPVGAGLGLDPAQTEAVLQVLVRAGLVCRMECGRSDASPPRELALREGPLVSVLVLNMDGREHLEDCFASLLRQTYRSLEIFLLDNGSHDDSIAWTREFYPMVRILDLGENLGFAGGNNAGLAAAQGEYMFCLNNDTELEPDCVAQMVAVIERDPQITVVAPLMKFFYLRGFVNSLGNVIPALGWGFDGYIGCVDVGQFTEPSELFAACFGAALLRRSVVEQIGPLDTGYHPIYYDDSEWCYRARLAGYRVLSAPRAVVYHKFSATTQRGMSPRKLATVARNRLRYAFKNLQWGTALRFGLSYVAEDAYHLLQAAAGRDWPMAGAHLRAWSAFARSLPDVLRQRRRVQRLRLRGLSDRQLYAAAREVPLPRLDKGVPYLTLPEVLREYAPLVGRRRVLIVSPDVVNANMAGPGIRYWELARVLSREFRVTLSVPGTCDLALEGVEVVCHQPRRRESLAAAVAAADVVVASGYVVHDFPFLRELDRPLVIDLYDPFIVENLHFHAAKPLADQGAIHRYDLAVLNDQLQAGDFFLCASEKQRDYCLGLLMANNRANPYTWHDDPTLRRLIDVLPFGMRDRPPRASGPGIKGRHPGIAAGDKVILWGGGVWEWLDPLTAIRAMPAVLRACPEARLFFIGIRHPSATFPDSRMAGQAVALAQEMGLLDRQVFFRDWTPYEERETLLLEADVGISLHFDHLETRLAFRTRLLDYIWAGLPMVVTGGDTLSEIVAAEGLGEVVEPEDVAGVARALIALLAAPEARTTRRAGFARAAERLSWEQAAAPLFAFCRAPHLAADKGQGAPAAAGLVVTPEPTPTWKLPARAWQILRTQGMGGLAREVFSYSRWLLTRFS